MCYCNRVNEITEQSWKERLSEIVAKQKSDRLWQEFRERISEDRDKIIDIWL